MTQFDSYKDEEQQKDWTRTWVALIVWFFVMIIAMWWLATRLNYKMWRIRDHFRSWVKRIVIITLILALVFGAILLILNLTAKKQEYDKHYTPDEEESDKKE